MNYEQLQLFDTFTAPQIKTIHDPYWDELEGQDDIVESTLFDTSAEAQNLASSVEIAHQQITLVGEQTSFNDSPYKSVGEQVNKDTLKVAHQHDGKLYDRNTEVTHWVEKYWVERVGNKYWYYRYTYLIGRKLHRHYIGSVKSNKAKLKKLAVEEAIADGQGLDEIIHLLKSWS